MSYTFSLILLSVGSYTGDTERQEKSEPQQKEDIWANVALGEKKINCWAKKYSSLVPWLFGIFPFCTFIKDRQP